jgi:transcription elongation GreA/GreB family factor
MITYFSKTGLHRLEQKIVEQGQLVVEAGQQVGEEAGIACDWHDNFGFEEARRRLDIESGRLKTLKSLREHAQLAPLPHIDSDRVGIGSKVSFHLGEIQKSLVIGAWAETLPKSGMVAYDSPIAKLVIGMHVGEIRDVNFQGKDIEIEVISVVNDGHEYSQNLTKLYGLESND